MKKYVFRADIKDGHRRYPIYYCLDNKNALGFNFTKNGKEAHVFDQGEIMAQQVLKVTRSAFLSCAEYYRSQVWRNWPNFKVVERR